MIIEDDGTPVNVDRVPPRVKRVADFLDKLELGKVMKTQTLTDRVGHVVDGFRTHPFLREYRIQFQHAVYWGSRETVARAKETQ